MSVIWLKLIVLPAIVVIAFGLFVTSLVVAAIGAVHPRSTPSAELSKLFVFYGRAYRGLHRVLDAEI